jgi:SAM-dependent methyltransferase
MSNLLIIKKWYTENHFPGPYSYEQIKDKDCLQNQFISNINKLCTPGSDIIDVGCGTGLFLNALALHNKQCNFYGVDFSDAVDYADNFAKTNNIKNVSYDKKDLFDLSTEKKYDVVVAQSVLTHTQNWQLALEILKSLVKDSGTLIVSVYSPLGKRLQKWFPKKIQNERLALDQYSNPLDVTVPYNYFLAGTSEFDICEEVPKKSIIRDFKNYQNGGLTVFNLVKNSSNKLVTDDLYNWIVNYVEKPHSFYKFKFPPCPFAKKIRIANDMIIKAYNKGSLIDFVNYNIELLLQSKKTVLVMFAPKKFDTLYNRYLLKNLNKKLVPKDRYLQVGEINVESRYDNKGEGYFAILLNRLSIVRDGHKFLKESTDFYKDWTKDHYKIVVEDRENLYKKYSNK